MKKLNIIPVAAILFSALGMHARPVTFGEAVSNALGDVRATRSADMRLLYTYADRGTNVAYFAQNTTTGGFMVIAADDVMPAVLGYSDSGEFDADNMPTAMRGWLQGYADQLQYMLSNGLKGAAVKSLPTHAAIAPLCAAKWNQSTPFNNDCPTVSSTVAPTGCTATAMAQAMYVHKWPKQGTGSNTYTPPGFKSPLTFDFGSTTFDWDNMLDSYSGSYTDTQAKAVAVLMAACGNAALMQYGASSSGAYPYNGLYGMVNFLGYDKGGEYVERDYYPADEWDALIYNELANRRPVVYGGYNYEAGHSFVVDGYDGAGYYHLNWGWGGMSNGYFLLSALNPSDQGIGGSSGGYSFGQDALVNLKPAEAGSEYASHLYQYGNLTTTSVYAPSIGSIEFKIEPPTSSEQGYLKPFTLTQQTITLGVKLTPEAGGEAVFYPEEEAATIAPYYGESSITVFTGFKVKVSGMPKEGVYIATPAYKVGDEVKDVRVKVGYSGKVRLTCSKSGVNMEPVAAVRTLVATDVKPLTTLYSGKLAQISVTFNNSGEEYLGLVSPVLRNANGDLVAWMEGVNLNVLPNEPLTTLYSGIFKDATDPIGAGDYLLDFLDEQGNYLCETPVPVTLKSAPAKASIDVTISTTCEGEGTYARPYLTGDILPIDMTIKAVSGIFDDRVVFYGYYPNGVGLPGSVTATNRYFVETGQSQTKTYNIAVNEVPLNEICFVHAYGWKPTGSEESTGWIGKDIYFKRVTSAVEEISVAAGGVSINPDGMLHISAKAAITSVAVYSISGMKMLNVEADGFAGEMNIDASNLAPAPYVIVVTTAEGTETHKVIIRI